MTVKQDLAMQKVLENHGNVSKAMLEAGYSPNAAKNPKILTTSKAWEEKMGEYLGDEKLLKVHDEGLYATRTTNAAILVTKDGKLEKAEEQGLIEVPDYATRHKYLETAYKLKKRMSTETPFGLDVKVVIMPSTIMEKYGISSNAEPSSEGQDSV